MSPLEYEICMRWKRLTWILRKVCGWNLIFEGVADINAMYQDRKTRKLEVSFLYAASLIFFSFFFFNFFLFLSEYSTVTAEVGDITSHECMYLIPTSHVRRMLKRPKSDSAIFSLFIKRWWRRGGKKKTCFWFFWRVFYCFCSYFWDLKFIKLHLGVQPL